MQIARNAKRELIRNSIDNAVKQSGHSRRYRGIAAGLDQIAHSIRHQLARTNVYRGTRLRRADRAIKRALGNARMGTRQGIGPTVDIGPIGNDPKAAAIGYIVTIDNRIGSNDRRTGRRIEDILIYLGIVPIVMAKVNIRVISQCAYIGIPRLGGTIIKQISILAT